MLELDDGAEVICTPGDTVVQNGTRHRWRNPGDGPPGSPCSSAARPRRRAAALSASVAARGPRRGEEWGGLGEFAPLALQFAA